MKNKRIPSSQSLPIPTDTYTVPISIDEVPKFIRGSNLFEDKDNRRNGYLISTVGDGYVRLFDLRWDVYFRRSFSSFVKNYVRVVLPNNSTTTRHYSEGGTMWDEGEKTRKEDREWLLKNRLEWVKVHRPDLLDNP